MAELKDVPFPLAGFKIRNQSQRGRIQTDNCWGNALGTMLNAASGGVIDFPRDATELRDKFDLAQHGGLGQGDLKKICANLRKLDRNYPQYKLNLSPPPFGGEFTVEKLRNRLELGAIAIAFIDYGLLPRSPFRTRAPGFYDSDKLGDDVGHVVVLYDFVRSKRQYRLFDPLDEEGSDGDIVKAADVERAIKKHTPGRETLLSVGISQWRRDKPASTPRPRTGRTPVIEIDRFPTDRKLTIPPRRTTFEIHGLAIDRATGSLKTGATDSVASGVTMQINIAGEAMVSGGTTHDGAYWFVSPASLANVKGQLITKTGFPEPDGSVGDETPTFTQAEVDAKVDAAIAGAREARIRAKEAEGALDKALGVD